MRNTKIVATIGPASEQPSLIKDLLEAGADVFRVNASHGTHGAHSARIRAIREAARELQVFPGILLDLQGPKIRLGRFEGGSATLETGAQFTLTTEPCQGNATLACTTFLTLPKDVKPGNRLLLADGAVELRATKVESASVQFEVVSGGTIKDQQGINLPGIRLSVPSMTEKDCEDLAFGLEQGVDFVALSFVRSPDDISALRSRLSSAGSKIPIIAKIEKPEALDHLDAILALTDGVMVARGDLGVEVALARVPGIQKTIIEKARMQGKFVITATQMLESMIEHSAPTRAEVSDVANAIFDGTDAVMLSGETAAGKYPLETVRMMAGIAVEAESYLKSKPFDKPALSANPTQAEIIAEAAYRAGLAASVKAIGAFTSSGNTPRLVARFRPHVPLYAFCETEAVARSLSVIYGAQTIAPVKVDSIEQMLQICDLRLLGEAWSTIGDNVVLVAGAPFGMPGSANMIQLHRVGAVGIQRGVE